MKYRSKLIAVILGISCLCGCNKELGVGKLNDVTTEMREEIDYNAVKDGFYISEPWDGSYYLIKDRKYTLIGRDFDKQARELNPYSEHSDMTDSEYDEYISGIVRDDILMYVDVSFVPVMYYNYPDYWPPITLSTSTEEEILNGKNSIGILMKDENTIGTEPPYYVYCGTSLPESE